MKSYLGIDVHAIISACRFPSKIEAELVQFGEQTLAKPQRTRRKKSVIGTATIEARIYGITSSISTLFHLGFKLTSLQNVGERHIEALHSAWTEQGGVHQLSVGRVHNLNVYLRLLFDVHFKKHGLVLPVSQYSKDCVRTYVTTRDKSWVGNGVDVHLLVNQIADSSVEGRIVAMQLELAWAFGLRVREAWMVHPITLLEQALDGELMRIDRGTKGGRPRDVPVTDLVQVDVLLRASDLARGLNASMIPLKYNLIEWKSIFYRLLKTHRVVRSTDEGGLGVTAHGLRHQYMHAFYQRLTGHEPPVRSAQLIDPDAHKACLKTLIEAVGHSDIRKVGAYLSTPHAMQKLQRLKALLTHATTTTKTEEVV